MDMEGIQFDQLPEIACPNESDEEDGHEAEPLVEDVLNDLLLNILHKSSNVALKAMKELEQMVNNGLHTKELCDSANHLVETIKLESRENCFGYKGATSNHLVNILLCRCEEERVNMKKAAISALNCVFLALKDPSIVDACAEKLSKKCRDQALAIRKQAAHSLTRMLQGAPQFQRLQSVWLHSVMHLIVDREPTVQLQAAKLVAEVLIEPIMHDSEGMIVWELLAAIEKEADLRRLMLRTLVFLHKEKSLPQALPNILFKRAATNPMVTNPCWMLLSELSAFLDIAPSTAIGFWSDNLNLDEPNRLIGYIAKLIANRANCFSFQQRQFLKGNIADALLNYKINQTYITAVYFMFARILNGIGQTAPGFNELTKFNQKWFSKSVKKMDAMIYVSSPDNQVIDIEANGADFENSPCRVELVGSLSDNTERLIRIITSIGECIQYTPALINKQIFKLLQVIIPSDVLKRVYQEHQNAATLAATTPRAFSLNTSFCTEMRATQSNAPSDINAPSNIQMRIRSRVFRSELMTREVRANAMLTLGKLCLQDEQLAKKCIPTFIRQLKQNSDHFVRNNIVVVVCDLCIRYTSLVDRYSTILASCLWDKSLLIRRQTLLLMTNLVKEQYLKWEGPIIFRFVTTLLDPDHNVQEYANFCLTDILLPQFKEKMFFHHFLECVFNFNGVKHASWLSNIDGFDLGNEVDQKCSLEGREKFESRMRLYKYMLNTFEDQQKVSVLEKIGLEIFVPIVEGGMLMTDMRVRNLLYDAFKIMNCNEIRLKMQLGRLDVDYEGDDEEPPDLVKTAAKKFISTTFRKSIAESVMPHLFSIRAFLGEKRSPLEKTCYSTVLQLCRDHEEQLDDFLASDPQMKAEIKFDLKRTNRPSGRSHN